MSNYTPKVCIPDNCAVPCSESASCPSSSPFLPELEYYCGAGFLCHYSRRCAGSPLTKRAQCDAEPNREYEGAVLLKITGVDADSWEKCCDLCARDTLCSYWSWKRVQSQTVVYTCTLHGATAFGRNAFSTSGTGGGRGEGGGQVVALGLVEAWAGAKLAACPTDVCAEDQNCPVQGEKCVPRHCSAVCYADIECPQNQYCGPGGVCEYRASCADLGQDCDAGRACGAGLKCVENKCLRSCSFDADCPGSYQVCVAGVCQQAQVARPPTPSQAKRNWDYCIPPQLPAVSCYCDDSCLFNGDCCVDFETECPESFSTALSLTDDVSRAYHSVRSSTTYSFTPLPTLYSPATAWSLWTNPSPFGPYNSLATVPPGVANWAG